MAPSHQVSGLPCVARALWAIVAIVVSGTGYFLTIVGAAAEEPPTITETALLSDSSAEVSDRESRLRDIEDELLKQLSVGSTPSAQEATPSSLPDIKHTPSSSVNAQPTAQPEPVKQAPTPIQAQAPKRVPIVEAKISEPSTTDMVVVQPVRRPEKTTMIPVTAKSAPRRTPKIKPSAATENLSAQDLEHRLAIAETQVTLLTKELETTKSKLAQSEARALDLSQEIKQGGAPAQAPQKTEFVESRTPETPPQGADDTDAYDTRADSYATTARVTKDNTPLRIGPSSRESTITRISRNNVVSIEHRTGGWYRIVTNNGTRGWISGSALIFDEGRSPGSTVQVGAFQPKLEVMDLKF